MALNESPDRVSLNGMQIDVIRYKPHALSLRPFKFFHKEFIKKEQSIKHTFIMGVVLKLWIYFM